jgi:hypothetical protein
MNGIGPALAMALLFCDKRENTKPIEVKEEFLPPYVKAKIDIPKSLRKGKTYSEILEIKKQIWQNQKKREFALDEGGSM